MKSVTAAAALCFFAFAVARAARVPLTYDEAAAYLRYIATDYPSVFNTDYLSIFNFEVATNHFLNTLLTKICYLVGGDSELVLRIPNLIGFAMYLWFSRLILHQFARGAIAFAGFMLLSLNPYVLDFFALSRGYGLSLGFLMGALFFLLRFLTQLHNGDAAPGDVSRTLLLGCGAVVANFTLLNVYLAICGVVLAAFVASNAIARVPAAPPPHEFSRRRHSFFWLSLVAAVFTGLVLSQDAGLSEALYQPVSVALVGLNEAELDSVTIFRIDLRGRETRLPRDPRVPVWRSPRRVHFRSLRIELPIAAADRLARVEAIVGSRSLSYDPRRGGLWTTRDAGTKRVFESSPSLSSPRSSISGFRPVMNWAGDARYLACVAVCTALALSVLAMLAVLLKFVARPALRANLLRHDQWRPLASGVLWLAALIGSPLYILKRDSQLYYGGTHGLIQDTFYSTIENSFYGKTYHPAQIQLAFAGILLTFAVFGIALYLNDRRRHPSSMLPEGCLLAIMVIASAAFVGQRFMFQTVYPLGRTALFYIPLCVLFVTFLCETISEFGQAGRTIAMSILFAALSFSMFHFLTTANLRSARDWPDDASTKAMMEDLGQVIAAERPSPSRVVLGVDWIYSPVAVYYAHKNTAGVIDVVVVPSPRGSDFLYVAERNERAAMKMIRRYPATRSVLAREGTTP